MFQMKTFLLLVGVAIFIIQAQAEEDPGCMVNGKHYKKGETWPGDHCSTTRCEGNGQLSNYGSGCAAPAIKISSAVIREYKKNHPQQ